MQVDPIKPTLKAPATKRLKLKYDKLLPSFGFNLNLRHFNQGPDFVLAVRYGEILNILFVTITFSAGLPILVPMAGFSFAVQYYVDKFDFMRVSGLPRYGGGTAMAEGAAGIIAYACIWHLPFAIWANSFYRMEEDKYVSGLVGVYVEELRGIWDSTVPAPFNTFFGAVPDTAEVARRQGLVNVLATSLDAVATNHHWVVPVSSPVQPRGVTTAQAQQYSVVNCPIPLWINTTTCSGWMSDGGCDRVDECFEQHLPGPARRILQRNTAWGTLGLWMGVVGRCRLTLSNPQ